MALHYFLEQLNLQFKRCFAVCTWSDVFKLFMKKGIMDVKQLSDAEILLKIKTDDINGWEDLYDKYAPIMLKAIVCLISDRAIAQRTLLRAFMSLWSKQYLSPAKQRLPVYLYVYAFNYAFEELKVKGITPKLEDVHDYPGMTQSLYKRYNS